MDPCWDPYCEQDILAFGWRSDAAYWVSGVLLFLKPAASACLRGLILGGSWVVIQGAISPLVGLITIVALLITTHETSKYTWA